jgi:NADH:ubiquinone oxidoreductase subunit K
MACYMFFTPLIILNKAMAEYAIILNLLLRLLRTSQKMNKVKTNEIKRLIETGYALSI